LWNSFHNPKIITRVDLCTQYDILILTNNHAEWCEGTGPMTTQQPYPKGAKASPNGNHEVRMTTGKIRPPLLGGFFVGK
jgi:hypothetical protein